MAGLYFTVGADFNKLQKLKRDIENLKTELRGMDKAANPKQFAKLEKQLAQLTIEFDREALAAQRAGAMTSQAGKEAYAAAKDFDQLNKMFLKFGGTAIFGKLLKDVVDVRSEFQNTEAMFKVFLGSAEKAKSFVGDLQKYAFNNVFEFKDLTQQAAQLLAFQHRFEDIIPIIDKLSNVAAGSNKPLSDLVDLYNKAKSQGKLMTDDIQQWQRAGVPVITELAQAFNVTEQAMWQMVTTGRVGFKEIDQVINKLTSSGGMFSGMMEEKMKTLGDSVGLLQDTITATFNEIGEASEDFLRGGILAANTLVENYKEVAEVLGVLVTMYGTAKAAMAINVAYSNSVQALRLKQEAIALEALMTTEQKAVVSKMNLTRGTAEYNAAIRTEIMAHNEAVQSKYAEAQADLQALYAKRSAAKEAVTLAKSRTSAAREELTQAIASAQAEVAAKQQKELAILKETASLTRRDAILLQSQKYQAEQIILDAKSAGASGARIKTLQLECNAITQKLAVAKAEAVQVQQNVVAKEAEIAAGVQSISTKKIETLTNRVNTLSEKENAAAANHNALVKQTVAGKILIKKIAQDADTVSTRINTTETAANTATTNILAVAKLRLAQVLTKVNQILMANKFTLAIAGTVALTYALYKLITYQTEAEKGMSRLNEAMREAEKGAIGESRELARLKGELAAAKKGTDEYNEVKDKIVKNYGKYYAGLEGEIERVGLLDTTYQKLTQSIQASFAARQYSKFMQEETDNLDDIMSKNLGKIQNRLNKDLGDEAGAKIYSQIRKSLIDGKEISADVKKIIDDIQDKGTLRADSRIDGYINNIKNAQKLTDDLDKKARIKFGIDEKSVSEDPGTNSVVTLFSNINEEVTTSAEKIKTLKGELADLRSGKTQSVDYTGDIEKKLKEIEDVEKKLATLTGKDKKTIKAVETAAEKAWKDAQDYKKAKDKQSQQEIRAAEDLEIQINEAELKAMDEGSKKVLTQLDLNYKKEKLALERHQEDALKTKIDNARAIFEADAQNKGKSFDDSSIKLSEDELKKYQLLLKKNEEIYQEERLSLELQYMRDYIKEYGTFQQKKLAIAQEYDKKIAAASNEYEKKSLENQKRTATSNVDFEAISKRIDWQGVFGNMTGMLESQLKETLSGLNEYVKTDQFRASSDTDKKTVFEAIQKLSSAIPGGQGTLDFNIIRQQMDDLGSAINNLQTATLNEKVAYDNLAKAQGKYEDALKSGDQALIDSAKINLDTAKNNANEASNAYKNAEANVESLGNTFKETATDTIDGLNLVGEGFNNFASNSLPQIFKGLQNTVTGLSKLNIGGEVGKAIGTLSKTLSSTGLVGQIISAALTILDVLKDGIGTLVANLIDTVLNAVDGILKDILSGSIVTKIANSLKDGIGNILNTVSFGGFGSLISSINGGNAKETAETISRLTTSNEALKISVDALKEEISGSNGVKSIEAYNEAVDAQKRYNENLRNILNSQMKYSSAHHSNSYYWDLNPNSLKEVNKLLGTGLKNSWGDFSKLTADQMNEIRKHLPDIWSEMINQGKYGARFKDDWNNYADQAGKVAEMTEDLRENIAQISFDNLRDSFVNALMDMDTDAQDFAGNFEEYMTKALLNFAIGDLLDDNLKKWYDSWTDSINSQNGELTEDQIEQYRKEWDAMVQQGLNTRDEIAALTGYTGKDSSSQQSSKGVYQGMSQDTGDRLEARNTAIHMETIKIGNNILTMSSDVRNMTTVMLRVGELTEQSMHHMEEIKTIQLNSYYELKDINNNTKELYQMNERLGQMNEKLSRL